MTPEDKLLKSAGVPVEILARTRPEDRLGIIQRLRDICAAERRRGLAGDFAYDKARHAQLYRLLEREIG
jgi:hypothetical protein